MTKFVSGPAPRLSTSTSRQPHLSKIFRTHAVRAKRRGVRCNARIPSAACQSPSLAAQIASFDETACCQVLTPWPGCDGSKPTRSRYAPDWE